MPEPSDEHNVEIVQRDRRAKGDDAAYWRCSCGQSAGGRWNRSSQEAAKAADRHLDRARNEPRGVRSGQSRPMWKFDGAMHRFTGSSHSIVVFAHEDPPDFTASVDVEVHVAGRRYSGTLMTPEQIRECLTRWKDTGESLPGDVFGPCPDLVLISKLSLDNIQRAVDLFVERGIEQSPLMMLTDEG